MLEPVGEARKCSRCGTEKTLKDDPVVIADAAVYVKSKRYPEKIIERAS